MELNEIRPQTWPLRMRAHQKSVESEASRYVEAHPEQGPEVWTLLHGLEAFWESYDPDNADHQRQIQEFWSR